MNLLHLHALLVYLGVLALSMNWLHWSCGSLCPACICYRSLCPARDRCVLLRGVGVDHVMSVAVGHPILAGGYSKSGICRSLLHPVWVCISPFTCLLWPAQAVDVHHCVLSLQKVSGEELHGALGQVVYSKVESQFLPGLWEFQSSVFIE